VFVRHLISINDLTTPELRRIIGRSAELSMARTRSLPVLDGMVTGIYFRKTSTRTRTSFSVAAMRLGAKVLTIGPDDLQVNTGESLEDTTAVLSMMLDQLVVRTAADPAELRTYAAQPRMAVISAMTADEHPTQAITDLATMLCRFGRLEKLRVCYVGEGNNSAAALALALSRFKGTTLTLRTPAGYGLDAAVLKAATESALAHGATIEERHTMDDLPEDLDVVYTTRWQTTGTSKADPNWRADFAPFQVTADLWRSSPRAVFLHDLPAHRGEEVTAEVLDGPASLAFHQAENKLYAAMAVLEWCARA
jgi:ornithine carbamoyltransferase